MLLALAGGAPLGAQGQVSTELRTRIEVLSRNPATRIAGRTLEGAHILVELYERRGYAPLWTDADATIDLLSVIRATREDGLNPADYHVSEIEAREAATPSPVALAELDLLRSDALLLVINDLRHGKLDPDDPASGRVLRGGENAATEVARIARSGRVVAEVEAIRPDHYIYRGLRTALAELRRVESAAGWDRLPDSPPLRAGMRDPRVGALRRRLAADVSGNEPLSRIATTDPDTFDAALEATVRSFQHRHALNEDGVVGQATISELNVAPAVRIAQIRINLERARWITRDLTGTFVAVNVAGARVYFVRSGSVVYESRAVVGQTSTRTPIFQASMRHIDLNPTWTVPPGIVGEVIADVRRDSGYLDRVGMSVIDHQGRSVDISPSAIARYSAANFPYVFRQREGPLNPLGQVKFVFPNPHNVYLHDTPARSLFEREQRTFSHGCIRLQNPLDLAVLILNDPERWSRDDLLAVIAEGRTRTIPLATPVPVLVLYWTASADLHGELHFYRDVYGRDDAVRRGLDS